MQYNLYKPNSKNTGCAFSFKIVERDPNGNRAKPTLLLQGIHQATWDSDKKTGTFNQNSKNPEKNIFSKLNGKEVGAILNAIEQREEFTAFHTFNDNKTTISFKPYEKKDGIKAFSLNVVKNSTLKFGIGIEVGEARTLKALLELYLVKLFEFFG